MSLYMSYIVAIIYLGLHALYHVASLSTSHSARTVYMQTFCCATERPRLSEEISSYQSPGGVLMLSLASVCMSVCLSVCISLCIR